MGFTCSSVGKESVCSRPRFHPCAWKIPWRKKWQPTPVSLPAKSHGQRSLVGCSPQGRKESDTNDWLNTHRASKPVCQVASVVSDSLQPYGLYSPPGALDSPGKNTGVGCHVLLQGIFLTQGLNLRLLWDWICVFYVSLIGRWLLYQQQHMGSPK